jgi:ADP-ribosylglycohydrolase
MIVRSLTLAVVLSLSVAGDTKTSEVDQLLEKVHQSKSPNEKKELIEKLKKRLAQENKKAQEEADAIIRAKKKVPMKIYDESLLKSK